MTQGSRADFPKSGTGWADPSAPAMDWGYWEDETRFGPISEEAKKQIRRKFLFFRLEQSEYNLTPRRDLKQLKRDLNKVRSTGLFPDESLRNYVEDHTYDFAFHNPEATLAQTVDYLLAEIDTDPSGFMMSSPKPQIRYTINLFELFSQLGLSVSRGSAADLNAMTDKSEAPATPFVEFVARVLWGISDDQPVTVQMAQNIQHIISNRDNYIARD